MPLLLRWLQCAACVQQRRAAPAVSRRPSPHLRGLAALLGPFADRAALDGAKVGARRVEQADGAGSCGRGGRQRCKQSQACGGCVGQGRMRWAFTPSWQHAWVESSCSG
jgi:hypothetical protein